MAAFKAILEPWTKREVKHAQKTRSEGPQAHKQVLRYLYDFFWNT